MVEDTQDVAQEDKAPPADLSMLEEPAVTVSVRGRPLTDEELLARIRKRREYSKGYVQSDASKESRKKYQEEHADELREKRQSPENKERQREYRERPDVKARQKAYRERPEVKAKQIAYRRKRYAEMRDALNDLKRRAAEAGVSIDELLEVQGATVASAPE